MQQASNGHLKSMGSALGLPSHQTHHVSTTIEMTMNPEVAVELDGLVHHQTGPLSPGAPGHRSRISRAL
jgi:hypothetical protein